MNVVSKSEAARMAGVSRQAINDLKNININGKKKYPFFVFDPGTGKPGVNIDHKEWLNYLDRNQSIRVKKKEKKQISESKVMSCEQNNNADSQNIIKAVVLAVQEKFRLNTNDLNDLLLLIDKKHDEIRGN